MRPGSRREARASEKVATRVPGVIRPDELYTIEEFVARTGLGETWRRRARRTGLQILYLNGRGFIWGGDFIDFVLRMATKEFRPKEKGSSATDSNGLHDSGNRIFEPAREKHLCLTRADGKSNKSLVG